MHRRGARCTLGGTAERPARSWLGTPVVAAEQVFLGVARRGLPRCPRIAASAGTSPSVYPPSGHEGPFRAADARAPCRDAWLRHAGQLRRVSPLEQRTRIAVGRLSARDFATGYCAYMGSALGRLVARRPPPTRHQAPALAYRLVPCARTRRRGLGAREHASSRLRAQRATWSRALDFPARARIRRVGLSLRVAPALPGVAVAGMERACELLADTASGG